MKIYYRCKCYPTFRETLKIAWKQYRSARASHNLLGSYGKFDKETNHGVYLFGKRLYTLKQKR